MECMCAGTRLWFVLSSERVLGNGVRTHFTSKGQIPFTGETQGAVISNHEKNVPLESSVYCQAGVLY